MEDLTADLKCREAYPFWVVRVTQGVRTGQGPGSGVVERRAVSVAAPSATPAFLPILGSSPLLQAEAC